MRINANSKQNKTKQYDKMVPLKFQEIAKTVSCHQTPSAAICPRVFSPNGDDIFTDTGEKDEVSIELLILMSHKPDFTHMILKLNPDKQARITS